MIRSIFKAVTSLSRGLSTTITNMKSSGLTSEKGSLPLHMRSGFSMQRFGGTFVFDEDGKIFEVAEKEACEELTVYHQFRVPYGRNIAQGRYDGTIVFRAYTL